MAGMPEQAAVFYDSGPVFETTEGFKGTVLARYHATPSRRSRRDSCSGEKYASGQGRRARRRARHRPRRPARLPPAVARPAVRHVPRDLQRGDVRAVRIGGRGRHVDWQLRVELPTRATSINQVETRRVQSLGRLRRAVLVRQLLRRCRPRSLAEPET